MDFHHAFHLDEENGKLFWKNPPKQHAQRVGKEAGCLAIGKGKNKTYWYVRLNNQTFKRSRVVFYMKYGRWPSVCIDHIDGDSLNDRPNNLREATYVQNAQNQKPRRNKKSGLPQGVTHYQSGYRAQIFLNKKRMVLGQFKTSEAASEAYQAARKELFNEYA